MRTYFEKDSRFAPVVEKPATMLLVLVMIAHRQVMRNRKWRLCIIVI